MENSNVFIEIMKENWLHARHVETERMWFANAFVVITAGAAALLGEEGLKILPLPVLYVLLVISIFWLLITIKLNAEFGNHMKAIERIFDDEKIPGVEKDKWRAYIAMSLSFKGGIWKIFRVSITLICFYSLAIVTLVSLVIYVLVSAN